MIFFSYYNILNIVTDLTSFKKWLKDYHDLVDYNELLDGYVFFLNTCFRGLIDTIILENSFGIEEDYIFYRARFVGINIDDIPITCEKTIFIKNIWEKTKNIRNSTNWDDITASIKDIVDLLKSFEKIYENYIVPVNGLPKNYALNSATILKTYIFLNDLQHGVPLAYKIAPILKSNLTEKQVDRSYLGYVYTLQYLWYILLGEQKFLSSSLKNLHLAHEICPLEESEKFSSFGLKVTRCKKDCWASLDRFFGIIKGEIIEHLEDELKNKSNFNNLLDTLLVCQNFDKNLIEDYLVKYKLKNPEYLSRDDNKSVYKKLDYYFMWYKADVLDGSKTSVFNGVPAFTSVLIGNIKKRRYFGNNEKVFILKVKHPVKGVKGYDYSYGVLIEAFGNIEITDYSGWLIFLDCANDYSGFGGSLHTEAEIFINKFVKEGSVEIKEIIMDKDVFIRYLLSKNISRSLEEIQKKAKDVCQESKGTPLQRVACAVRSEVQKWKIGSSEEMAQKVEDVAYILKTKVADIPENEYVLSKIEVMRYEKDIIKQYEALLFVIGQIPTMKVVSENVVVENISKVSQDLGTKLNDISQEISEIRIRLKSGIREEIEISSGIEILGTGAKHIVTIPLQEISYDELKDDLKRIKGKNITKLSKLPDKLARKIKGYLLINNREDLVEQLT
jgi:hypothetical protein